jgi:transposase
MRRTAVINQIRGLLLEPGMTLQQGRRHVDEALPGILEDASAKLSGAVRLLLAQRKLDLDDLQMRIDEAEVSWCRLPRLVMKQPLLQWSIR